jgi:hypothetical protein
MYAIAVIISLVFILIYLNSFDLYGFWIVSEQFKQDSGLDQLMMYFDKSGDGYIILTADGNTLYNDKMKFNINQRGINTYSLDMGTEMEYMPKSMIMSVYPSNGFMELKGHNNVVYARLFKDNQMSANIDLK